MKMSKFSNIKAVFFDMDGTLIEHTWQKSQITQALFNQFASKLSPLTYQDFFDVFWLKNADMWYMMVDGVIDGDTAQLYSYINTLRALQQDTTLANDMVAFWTQLVLKEAILFDETHHVLKTLRSSFTTGIITNGFVTLQQAKLKQYSLEQAVDFCFISEAVGFHKPDVRIFAKALQKAGNINPEEAIFVGDTLNTDIKGAQNAGLHPVLINTRSNLVPPEDVTTITKLAELLTLLS